MGFRGLCEAMNAHGTTILKGTMMFDGAMMFDDQGVIPELNCQWRKIRSAFSETEDVTPLSGKLNSTIFSRVRKFKTNLFRFT